MGARAVKGRGRYALRLVSYNEHALEEKFTSKAASYVCIVQDGKPYWGAGIHSDIMASSLNALLSAVNRMLAAEK